MLYIIGHKAADFFKKRWYIYQLPAHVLTHPLPQTFHDHDRDQDADSDNTLTFENPVWFQTWQMDIRRYVCAQACLKLSWR